MGLFGQRYQKEGPGVSKDSVEKRKFFLFFELYFRKFWKLIKLNMLYFIVNIITILSLCVLVMGRGVKMQPGVIDGVALIAFCVLILSGIIVGPSTAALTYVLRNYANEKHSFMVSDFFDKFKENFKQAAVIGVINNILPIAFAFSLHYYSTMKGAMGIFFLSLTTLCAILSASASLYVYQIMVTFTLKLSAILKNSVLLAFANFPVNLLVLVIDGAILYATSLYLSVYLFVILSILILFSTIGFVAVFSTWGAIKKYMMPKEQHKEEEAIFSDDRILK